MLVYIEKQESIYAVLKKISQVHGEIVELVIPEYSTIAKNSLNFKLIEKMVKDNKKKLHLITTDTIVQNLAKQIGISVSETALGKQSVDWETANSESVKEPEKQIETETKNEAIVDDEDEILENENASEVDKTVVEDDDDETDEPVEVRNEEVKEDKASEVILKPSKVIPLSTGKKKNSQKSKSFGRIFGIFFIIALFFVTGMAAFAYFILPKAVVQIYLSGKDISLEKEITVDIGAIEVNSKDRIIPGSVETVEESGSKSTGATGKKQIGEKAEGTVTIQNFTLVETLFPAGTTYTVIEGEAGAGLEYVSDSGVTVPEATETISEDTEGNPQKIITPGTAEISVTAGDVGSSYNVVAKTKFSVDGETYSNFRAVNNSALSGGSSQEVSVVTEADRSTVKAQLLDELQKKAEKDLESKLVGDQRIITSTISHKVLSETYDKTAGEQAQSVSVAIKTESRVTVYSFSMVKRAMEDVITESIPEKFTMKDEEVAITPELIRTLDNGNVVFLAKVKGKAYPEIDAEQVKNRIKGLKPSDAQAYIKGMDKVVGYNISMWPPYPQRLQRLPYLDTRIEVKVSIKSK